MAPVPDRAVQAVRLCHVADDTCPLPDEPADDERADEGLGVVVRAVLDALVRQEEDGGRGFGADAVEVLLEVGDPLDELDEARVQADQALELETAEKNNLKS